MKHVAKGGNESDDFVKLQELEICRIDKALDTIKSKP